ncbi:MAG: hypothetical protein MR510_15215 [Clostridium sp.]|nr:hypothetical protein [Clostridium sp.]
MTLKFSNLPDYMTIDELKTNFEEFLKYYDNYYYNIEEGLEDLYELADRQWHTYELLSDSLKEKIEEYLYKIIDLDSYPIMDWILVIIPRLGLENVFFTILKRKKYIKNIEVLKLIEEAEEEYGDTVSNPYSGF